MQNREGIRLRRKEGKPPPWTADPILATYKFTNVRREHDRTTMELRQRFYDKYGATATAAQVLFNCATYRYFGTVDLAQAVGWQTSFSAAHVIRQAETVRKHGGKVFTGAYMITMNGKTGKKHEYVAQNILAPLAAGAAAVAHVAECGRWEAVLEKLRQFEGFAGTGFMAKEVILDTMFCPAFWPNGISDKDDWTPLGPGARRGLNRVLGRDLNASMPADQMLKWILDIRARQHVNKMWPKEWGPLSAHDIQFQLCEFDKYERARLGEGRPKAKFRPTA